MKTRSLFVTLGFQENWNAMTDLQPAYAFDFGNLCLVAAQVMSRSFRPCFLLGGVVQDRRSLGRLVQFEIPLEIESHEQGVALIAHAIGADFQPTIPTPWLLEGQACQAHLPWRHK